MDWLSVGKIFGYAALAESLLIFVSTKRTRILFFKMLAELLWSISYVCMGAYTGALLNFICIGREVVFSQRGKRKWASSIVWLFVFIAILMASPVFDIREKGFEWYFLLPAVGSTVAVLGFWNKKPLLTRFICIFEGIPWLIYAAIVENYSSMISTVIQFLSIAIGTAHELIFRHRAAEAAKETPPPESEKAKSATNEG